MPVPNPGTGISAFRNGVSGVEARSCGAGGVLQPVGLAGFRLARELFIELHDLRVVVGPADDPALVPEPYPYLPCRSFLRIHFLVSKI